MAFGVTTLYHYWIDLHFGWMNARIQSWLPFSIQICLNGREWLARMMDHHQIRYRQNDNCFPWIEDVDHAQRLMNPSVADLLAQSSGPNRTPAQPRARGDVSRIPSSLVPAVRQCCQHA